MTFTFSELHRLTKDLIDISAYPALGSVFQNMECVLADLWNWVHVKVEINRYTTRLTATAKAKATSFKTDSTLLL